MSKNPLVNAMLAIGYILVVSFVMNLGSQMDSPPNKFIMPVAFLSLFTLSAAVMGFLFGYQPAQLYFDGKKKQAVNIFLKTIAFFAGITVFFLFLAFSGIFS